MYWLPTGYINLNFMSNVSFGQRQLVLGNKGCGKTTLMSNILKNISINNFYPFLQTFNIWSFFNFIGSSRRELLYHTSIHKTLNKFFNFFIDGTGSVSLYEQLYTPIISQNFCKSLSYYGIKTLQILDSLNNHAKLYRNLMLTLKRAPGREAFPGDIFYIHSSLLENFGQYSYFFNTGSRTAFPLVGIQKNDITDYITTNLISITDGQWFLSSLLAKAGKYPSLDINLSVSRLGDISQSGLVKYIGIFVKNVVSRFLFLKEFKTKNILSYLEYTRYLNYSRVYSLFFINKGISYVKMLLLVLSLLLVKSTIFCHNLNISSLYLHMDLSVFTKPLKALLYWLFNTSYLFSFKLFLNYFYIVLKSA